MPHVQLFEPKVPASRTLNSNIHKKELPVLPLGFWEGEVSVVIPRLICHALCHTLW